MFVQNMHFWIQRKNLLGKNQSLFCLSKFAINVKPAEDKSIRKSDEQTVHPDTCNLQGKCPKDQKQQSFIIFYFIGFFYNTKKITISLKLFFPLFVLEDHYLS